MHINKYMVEYMAIVCAVAPPVHNYMIEYITIVRAVAPSVHKYNGCVHGDSLR